jgi:hypothetical protein
MSKCEPTQREVELECECAELVRKLAEVEPLATYWRWLTSRYYKGGIPPHVIMKTRSPADLEANVQKAIDDGL